MGKKPTTLSGRDVATAFPKSDTAKSQHFPTFSRILMFLRFSPAIRTIKTIIKNNVTFQINQQSKVLGQTSSA